MLKPLGNSADPRLLSLDLVGYLAVCRTAVRDEMSSCKSNATRMCKSNLCSRLQASRRTHQRLAKENSTRLKRSSCSKHQPSTDLDASKNGDERLSDGGCMFHATPSPILFAGAIQHPPCESGLIGRRRFHSDDVLPTVGWRVRRSLHYLFAVSGPNRLGALLQRLAPVA